MNDQALLSHRPPPLAALGRKSVKNQVRVFVNGATFRIPESEKLLPVIKVVTVNGYLRIGLLLSLEVIEVGQDQLDFAIRAVIAERRFQLLQ